MNGRPSLSWLLDHTLPMNRKERFFTGTVLPGIVCADLSELRRLTALMGHPDVEVSPSPDDCGIVFFTEYGIAESAYGPSAPRFTGLSTARDTPDVVFLTTHPRPALFALEAKMYDRPGGGALRQQLDLQRDLLVPLAERLATWLQVEDVPVVHYALLPAQQAQSLALDPYRVITWQQVHDAFADVAPRYWLTMLAEALARYDDLVTRAVANDADRLTGEAIVSGHRAGTFSFTAMGRAAGLDGETLRADIGSGAWRTTRYQVAFEHPGNRNWFSIADFVERVAAASQTREDALAELRQALTHGGGVATRVFGEGSVAQTLEEVPDDAFEGVSIADIRRVAAAYQRAAEATRVAREGASGLVAHVTRPRP